MVKLFKKNYFLIIGLVSLLGLYLILPRFFKATSDSTELGPDLVIYAYSSFTAAWGPGPLLIKKFEEECHCKLRLINGEDSRRLLNRLQVEKERSGADLVIGINDWDVDEAVDTLGFQAFRGSQPWTQWLEENSLSVKPTLLTSGLVPFDWGMLSINTKKESDFAKARNWSELLKILPDHSLTISDPRTSAPGWAFLSWLVGLYGTEGAFQFLEKLSPKLSVIASDWSASYGLFQKGQSAAAFSYVTSPLYHLIEEKDDHYRALELEEPLPVQLELAGVLRFCQHCDRAQKFLDFLLSDEAQKILMSKNYMFPLNPQVTKGTPWDIQNKFKKQRVESLSSSERRILLEKWTQWMRTR